MDGRADGPWAALRFVTLSKVIRPREEGESCAREWVSDGGRKEGKNFLVILPMRPTDRPSDPSYLGGSTDTPNLVSSVPDLGLLLVGENVHHTFR